MVVLALPDVAKESRGLHGREQALQVTAGGWLTRLLPKCSGGTGRARVECIHRVPILPSGSLGCAAGPRQEGDSRALKCVGPGFPSVSQRRLDATTNAAASIHRSPKGHCFTGTSGWDSGPPLPT